MSLSRLALTPRPGRDRIDIVSGCSSQTRLNLPGALRKQPRVLSFPTALTAGRVLPYLIVPRPSVLTPPHHATPAKPLLAQPYRVTPRPTCHSTTNQPYRTTANLTPPCPPYPASQASSHQTTASPTPSHHASPARPYLIIPSPSALTSSGLTCRSHQHPASPHQPHPAQACRDQPGPTGPALPHTVLAQRTLLNHTASSSPSITGLTKASLVISHLSLPAGPYRRQPDPTTSHHIGQTRPLLADPTVPCPVCHALPCPNVPHLTGTNLSSSAEPYPGAAHPTKTHLSAPAMLSPTRPYPITPDLSLPAAPYPTPPNPIRPHPICLVYLSNFFFVRSIAAKISDNSE